MEHFHTEILPDHDVRSPGERGFDFRRFLLDFLETIVLSLVLFWGINAVTARIRVESVSMQPTLYAGNFVIVNKVSYLLSAPSRGDVIIFRFPPDPDREPYVKRIIGLSGDTVKVSAGKVYVNDVPLDEPYIKAPPRYEGSWVVEQDFLFVLGDNRNSSSDSHRWGLVPIENVIGKAEVVYWPPSNWKMLNQASAAAAGENRE